MTVRSRSSVIEMQPEVGVLPPTWKKIAEPYPGDRLREVVVDDDDLVVRAALHRGRQVLVRERQVPE